MTRIPFILFKVLHTKKEVYPVYKLVLVHCYCILTSKHSLLYVSKNNIWGRTGITIIKLFKFNKYLCILGMFNK